MSVNFNFLFINKMYDIYDALFEAYFALENQYGITMSLFNTYGRYWFIKHTDPNTGKLTETRFTSLSAAEGFYEEMYHMFEANYITIKFGIQEHGKRR